MKYRINTILTPQIIGYNAKNDLTHTRIKQKYMHVVEIKF